MLADLEAVRPDTQSEHMLKPLLGYMRDLLKTMMPLETLLNDLSQANKHSEIMQLVDLL